MSSSKIAFPPKQTCWVSFVSCFMWFSLRSGVWKSFCKNTDLGPAFTFQIVTNITSHGQGELILDDQFHYKCVSRPGWGCGYELDWLPHSFSVLFLMGKWNMQTEWVTLCSFICKRSFSAENNDLDIIYNRINKWKLIQLYFLFAF